MNQDELLKKIQELENKIFKIESHARWKKKKFYILFAILVSVTMIIASSITKPHTFSDGEILSAGKLNANFDTLYSKVNELDSTISVQGIPVGTVVAYGGTSVPTGWLLCNGQSLNRSTYTVLFSTIGTSFGNGDGSTTFNVPDFRGRFLRGLDGTAGIDLDKSSRIALNGGNTGNAIGSYQDDAFKNHIHRVADQTGSAQGGGGAGSAMGQPPFGAWDTQATGGNETRPKNVYVNFIIKY